MGETWFSRLLFKIDSWNSFTTEHPVCIYIIKVLWFSVIDIFCLWTLNFWALTLWFFCFATYGYCYLFLVFLFPLFFWICYCSKMEINYVDGVFTLFWTTHTYTRHTHALTYTYTKILNHIFNVKWCGWMQGSKGIRQWPIIDVHPQWWYTKLPLLQNANRQST